uniref:Putative ovule protein n=1 Tax=Solanum chacoense TaxID=4108 RepID=A0A0V0GL89_SOLCH
MFCVSLFETLGYQLVPSFLTPSMGLNNVALEQTKSIDKADLFFPLITEKSLRVSWCTVWVFMDNGLSNEVIHLLTTPVYLSLLMEVPF